MVEERRSEWAPWHWDQLVRAAADQWLRWKARNRERPEPEEDSLSRSRGCSGRSAFRAASELPEVDPLREPLRRWVYRLAEQRINHDALTSLSLYANAPREIEGNPRLGPASLRELRRAAVVDTPRREVWLRLFFNHAGPWSDGVATLWQRRREVARRMGLDAPGQIERPLPADAERSALRIAEELARELRARTDTGRGVTAWLDAALGTDCLGVWPGRISPRSLQDFFRDGDLLRSLRLTLEPLPTAVGASSFCRALGSLGAAWHRAQAPRDQPFVIANDPYHLRQHTIAGLFALLPLNPEFAERRLQVTRLERADAERKLGRVWAMELSMRALRVRLRPHALSGREALVEAARELGAELLGEPIPESAAGLLPALRVEDEQRLVGMLLAVARARELTDAHDSDWFRNPRAIEELRAEASSPPPITADLETLERGLRLTLSELDRMLA